MLEVLRAAQIETSERQPSYDPERIASFTVHFLINIAEDRGEK
jgi:hypothetical protein